MAEKEKSSDSPFQEMKFYGAILFVLVIMWLFAGGYQDMVARNGPFLKPPSPISTGDSYGPNIINKKSEQKITIPHTKTDSSLYKDLLYLDGKDGLRNIVPSAEYVKITAASSNSSAIPLSNMRLISTPQGGDIQIGRGTKIVEGRVAQTDTAIILRPNESLYIITGTTSDVPIQNSFYPFWIINLHRTQELWPQTGGILLLDASGNLVDTLVY